MHEQELLIIEGSVQLSKLLDLPIVPERTSHLVVIPYGNEACVYLRDHPLDLVLLDLTIPADDLRRIVYQLLALTNPPAVIAVANDTVTSIPVEMYRITLSNCLFAPIDAHDIRRAVATALQQRSGQNDAQDAYDLLQRLQEAEQENRELGRRLVQSEKLSTVGQLIGGVAHELNNPLTSVSGYAQLLMRDKSLSSDARQDVQQIYHQAERAGRIVRNLLLFIREHKPEQVEINLNDVIRDALSLQAYQLRVDNIVISANYAPNLPATIADPHQLQQVVLNLITNAHYAMVERGGRGTLTLTTRIGSSSRERVDHLPQRRAGSILVTVADTGIGIGESDLAHIFEPFYTTKPVGKGTGLGLSLCAEIIHKHHGRIWAESTLGEGTRVHFELPIVGTPDTDHDHDDGKSPYERQHVSSHILIVDDEEGVGQLLARVFQAMGHQPHFVDQGSLAVDELNRGTCDLVFLDVKMPDMNGFDLYRIIQQRYPHLSQRVVFITGDTANPVTQSRLAQTNRPVLEKPFNAEQVEAMVRLVMRDLAEDIE